MEQPDGKFADLVMFSSENPVRIFMPLGPLYFTNSNDRKINRLYVHYSNEPVCKIRQAYLKLLKMKGHLSKKKIQGNGKREMPLE